MKPIDGEELDGLLINKVWPKHPNGLGIYFCPPDDEGNYEQSKIAAGPSYGWRIIRELFICAGAAFGRLR